MKPTQGRAEAGARRRHEGAVVPGVNWEGSEVGRLGLVSLCGFEVFTCL